MEIKILHRLLVPTGIIWIDFFTMKQLKEKTQVIANSWQWRTCKNSEGKWKFLTLSTSKKIWLINNLGHITWFWLQI